MVVGLHSGQQVSNSVEHLHTEGTHQTRRIGQAYVEITSLSQGLADKRSEQHVRAQRFGPHVVVL